jgi:hypothetical protein
VRGGCVRIDTLHRCVWRLSALADTLGRLLHRRALPTRATRCSGARAREHPQARGNPDLSLGLTPHKKNLQLDTLCYNTAMTQAERILAAITGPDPPQSMHDLHAKVGGQMNTCYQHIGRLLRKGTITPEMIPWRKFYRAGTTKPKPRPLTKIILPKPTNMEQQLENWMNDGGKDRVAAARLLAEMRGMGTDAFTPPPVNDRDGELNALSRCMAAAGRDVTLEALRITFPEAPIANPPPDLAGVPASGGPVV